MHRNIPDTARVHGTRAITDARITVHTRTHMARPTNLLELRLGRLGGEQICDILLKSSGRDKDVAVCCDKARVWWRSESKSIPGCTRHRVHRLARPLQAQTLSVAAHTSENIAYARQMIAICSNQSVLDATILRAGC